MRLIVASNNTAKTKELTDVYALFGIEVVNYRALFDQQKFPNENRIDLLENATVKAQFIHEFLPDEAILADDGGLFLTAFPERFGAVTQRELADQQLQTDTQINQYLLNLYTPTMDRGAYLQSAQVLILPDQKIVTALAKGGIALATQEVGQYSRGLDKIMLAENQQTFAQITDQERVSYSHRGRAAKELLTKLP